VQEGEGVFRSARVGIREVHKRISARAAQTKWVIEGWGERVPSLAPLLPKRPPSYKGGREVSGKGDRPAKFIAGLPLGGGLQRVASHIPEGALESMERAKREATRSEGCT